MLWRNIPLYLERGPIKCKGILGRLSYWNLGSLAHRLLFASNHDAPESDILIKLAQCRLLLYESTMSGVFGSSLVPDTP
jgi:hypothetical protein